ncbi:MAG TPA: NgoFVII family restriction endonuclease, partial [Clostridiaceae bacterium]|nr:NgoFVII family restriction endonuclease [Clostridiaceae bacterium]
MEFLSSNFPPVKTKFRSFTDAFYDLLPKANSLDIAVGYITADSLIELQKLVELNRLHALNLIIGMHYFERFTKTEYNAAMKLNSFLQENQYGEVRLVTPFKYHGKLYAYSDSNGPFAGIIGSNNLSSIIEGGNRTYESSLLISERNVALDMKKFINQLSCSATENIRDLDIKQFNNRNSLLEEHENVQKVTPQALAECIASLTSTTFEIPIKGAEISPQSNLNVFFGRGRVSPNGLVKPRHWYEVEIIVPNSISTLPGYPRAKTPEADFQVITDDGWTFRCKISGTNNKNLRSEGDLKIL